MTTAERFALILWNEELRESEPELANCHDAFLDFVDMLRLPEDLDTDEQFS